EGILMASTMHPAAVPAAGDELHLSNRDFLAWCHYHRYVPTPYAPPNRPLRTAYPAFGYPMTGSFDGKLIMLPSVFDGAAPRAGARWPAVRAPRRAGGNPLARAGGVLESPAPPPGRPPDRDPAPARPPAGHEHPRRRLHRPLRTGHRRHDRVGGAGHGAAAV